MIIIIAGVVLYMLLGFMLLAFAISTAISPPRTQITQSTQQDPDNLPHLLP